jgi:hypothetical protein
MVMEMERVVVKLLETLNSNVDSCCCCQCLRGKRVRRKALVEDPPMRELDPEHSSAERSVRGHACGMLCAHVCQ